MSQRTRSLLDGMKIYALPISVVLLGLLLSVGVCYWLREEGFTTVTITRLDGEADARQGSDIGRYFPVTYVELTLPGRKAPLIGIDYLSGSSRRSFLKRTVEENATSALVNSPSLRSLSSAIQGDTKQRVFLLLRPIYGGQHMFVRDFFGRISPFSRPGAASPSASRFGAPPPDQTEDMSPFVYPQESSDSENLLYAHNGDRPEVTCRNGVVTWWTYEREITLGDKIRTVMMNPSDSYLSERRTACPWVVLLLGPGLAVLFGRLSYGLSGEYLSRKKQFYSVFDNASYAIATVDERGRIGLWNESDRSMSLYDNSEARNRDFFELLELEDEDGSIESLEELLGNGEGSNDEEFREVRVLDSDGQSFPINVGPREWELQGNTVRAAETRGTNPTTRADPTKPAVTRGAKRIETVGVRTPPQIEPARARGTIATKDQ